MIEKKSETKGKAVWLDYSVMDEARTLVEIEEGASINAVMKKILYEFNIMAECLEQYGLLAQLHPEWQYTSERTEELQNPLFLEKLSEIFQEKDVENGK